MTETKISYTLMLCSSFINNIGLLNGKLGIAIYLFNLSHKRHRSTFAKFAEGLIDQIFDSVTNKTNLGFENGLAGIGWGTEYLVEQKFLDGDTNVILEDIDSSLYNNILNNKSLSIGFKDGAIGYGFYFHQRLKNLAGADPNFSPVLNKGIAATIDFLYEKRDLLLKLRIESLNNLDSIVNYFSSLLLFIEVEKLNCAPERNREMLMLLFNNLTETQFKTNSEFISLVTLYFKELIGKYNIISKDKPVFPSLKLSNLNIKTDRLRLKQEIEEAEDPGSISLYVGVLYYLLFNLTNDCSKLLEFQFWKEYNNKKGGPSSLADLHPGTNSLGLFQGLSGLGLLNLIA